MNFDHFFQRAFAKIKRETCIRLRPLFRLVPTKKNLWIFGAWQGTLYADNAKYLFEYVVKNHPEIEAVWMTRSDDVVASLRKKGYKCYKNTSLKGLLCTFRAECAFETEGEWDISYLLDPVHTVIIQLWHGMGVKAMNWNSEEERKKINLRFRPYHWAATSELYVNIISELTDSDPSRFCITGYPRNDTFITKPENADFEALKRKYPGSRFVIYMPTHRNFGKDGNKHINIDNLRQVDKKLAEKNIVMVYKPHFHELKNFLAYENDFSNIILAKEEKLWADVYSYLHYFDLLISDYSSVITDFMCSGKPVVYFAYDLEEYVDSDAGLNDYFWSIPGGPMCKTWDEVINESAALLENDTWKEERERCRIQYHFYNDGKNCERVYESAVGLLNEK